jgi:hypothetical protein
LEKCIAALVDRCCDHARLFAERLSSAAAILAAIAADLQHASAHDERALHSRSAMQNAGTLRNAQKGRSPRQHHLSCVAMV